MTRLQRFSVLALVLSVSLSAAVLRAQAPAPQKQDIIAEVRALIAKSDFTAAETKTA